MAHRASTYESALRVCSLPYILSAPVGIECTLSARIWGAFNLWCARRAAFCRRQQLSLDLTFLDESFGYLKVSNRVDVDDNSGIVNS